MINNHDNITVASATIARITAEYTQTIKWCSPDLEPIITQYFQKCISTIESVPNSVLFMEKYATALLQFSKNFKKNISLNEKDLESFNKIIGEFDSLYAEILAACEPDVETIDRYILTKKISFISEIFCKNSVGLPSIKNEASHDLIFENYENLYDIISLINENFDMLDAKGVSLNSFWYPFWNFCKSEVYQDRTLSEEDKKKMFIGLLNGTMKFQPVEVRRFDGYSIQPIDFKGPIVRNLADHPEESIAFETSDLSFEKGKQKIIETKKD
ncbi:MAG: hypothetical protein R3Y21_03215 [Mycoplasmatota bacterium]